LLYTFLLFQIRTEVQRQLHRTKTWHLRPDIKQEVSVCSLGFGILNGVRRFVVNQSRLDANRFL